MKEYHLGSVLKDGSVACYLATQCEAPYGIELHRRCLGFIQWVIEAVEAFFGGE